MKAGMSPIVVLFFVFLMICLVGAAMLVNSLNNAYKAGKSPKAPEKAQVVQEPKTAE